jgi:hypothetical protein
MAAGFREEAMSEQALPRYKCFKEVGALKIAGVQERQAPLGPLITPVWDLYPPFEAEAGWIDRFRGDGGDLGYYVVYEDGYVSWSPTKAFEDGYSAL